ncbi:MAG: hypothetical protein JW900_11060 [Anaerolineae bacterium]|nr:hypothetical protein [Anaerolineae bacterium]
MPEPTLAPPPSQAFPYGVVYADPQSAWQETDRPAIRERLEALRALHVNVVVQTFDSRLVDSGEEARWLIYLDEAERAGIGVIARLWPPNDWNGTSFDLTYVGRFLQVVGDHPALVAYVGLHEPQEDFTSEQLRAFYRGLKEIAPQVPIFHFNNDLSRFERSLRYPGRDFSDDICDICAVFYYPFRIENGQTVFERQELLAVVSANAELVHARDPDAQFWFLGQAFADADNPHAFRAPAPEEMLELARMVLDVPGVDGFLWYPYQHGAYDLVLSDPEMASQRQAVREAYERYVERAP